MGDVEASKNESVVMDAAGLYLPALDLHLDPTRPVRRAFLSHAHGDHAAGLASGTVLASPETLALLETRTRTKALGAHAIGWGETAALTFEGAAAELRIAPAGHMLGAAQLVVDVGGKRLVYTGDYRSGPGTTHGIGAPVPCDELVIESTFALPIFAFPDRDATRASIVAWCRETLASGATPVLLAHALGKAQVLTVDLAAAGIPVVAHGAAYRMCEAYEALGVDVGIARGLVAPYASLARDDAATNALEGGKKKAKRAPRTAPTSVVIVPPYASRMLRDKGDEGAELRASAREVRVALVSGWALLDAPLEQRRADAGFALSDHADHDDLVATALATGARRVYATHGNAAALARALTLRGVDAVALDAPPTDSFEAAGDAP